MKTEAGIRRHLADLRTAMDKPCGCAGTKHAMKCLLGGLQMKATIMTLAWIVGENDDMQRLVDEIHRDMEAYRASLN